MRINTSAVRFGAGAIENGNGVTTVAQARIIAQQWCDKNLAGVLVDFGLPEVDDRYEAWQVALLSPEIGLTVGNLRISCRDGCVLLATSPSVIENRLHPKETPAIIEYHRHPDKTPTQHHIVLGDSRHILREYHAETVDLAITSPPYFNAKPECVEYATYEEYLALLSDVFAQCHRLLHEGRFMVVNASPVLIRRAKRSQSSHRIPVPFHINSIMERVGFDFIDDIIWVKPSGAGWNTGRGRRFAADRHPLQYKPVPVTEYFLVYRKQTSKLIDWNIRNHRDQDAVGASKITDGYEVTNVWYSTPSHHANHPATFPEAIIRKLIRYYSFKGDTVLDPFAGIGTVGKAATAEARGYFLIDNNEEYYKIMVAELPPENCQ